MSDEDESISEGFSASEDEWKPEKQKHDDGESSDDDDSDFEEAPGINSTGAKAQPTSRKRETVKNQPKNRTDGGGVAKKRKPMGQSLRAKLYNKYRPPPKTFPSSNSGNNSPTASTSRTASKNELTPNEVGYIDNDDSDNDGSSSDSSVGNHLVNPAELDLRSNFFNTENAKGTKAKEQTPVFDCNAGVEQLSDSDAEDNNENSNKAFDFRHLLEKANSLERVKEQIAKRNAKSTKTATKSSKSKVNALDDVTTLLALGENQNLKHDIGAEEDDEDDDDDDDEDDKNKDDTSGKRAPSKLNKTKSTRIKRHTKTRPTSQILTASGGNDSDDSDWEEVAEDEKQHHRSLAADEDLQIIVEPASRKRTKEEKTQHELELAFKRRLNRDLKEKQMLLHKASLLYLFGRSYNYNRLLNDLVLMQAALKLLPGAKAYPRETGTELKYFQSFVTWFKTVVKLSSPNLYADDGKVGKTWADIKTQLLDQIKKKEARCKQDMIFIFISLIRGMGLQCRLVVNLQPLPLRPAQQDLLTIKLKADDTKEVKKNTATEIKTEKPTTSSQDKKRNANKNEHNSSKENNEKDKTKKAIKSEKSEKSKNTKEQEDSKNKKEQEVSKKKPKTIEKNKMTLSQKLSHNENKETIAENLEKEKVSKEKSEPKKQPNLPKLKRSIDENSTDADKPKKSKSKSSNETTASTSTANRINASDSGIQSEGSIHNNSVEAKDVPEIVIESNEQEEKRTTRGKSATKTAVATVCPTLQRTTRSRSRSISPRPLISTEFLQTRAYKEKFSPEPAAGKTNNKTKAKPKSKTKNDDKPKIATDFLNNPQTATARVLRSRQNSNKIPQLDGADDELEIQPKGKKRPQLSKLQKTKQKSAENEDSDADFEPSPSKQPKRAPVLPKAVEKLRTDRRIVSTDNESDAGSKSPSKSNLKKSQAADMWIEVWSDLENEWICVDLFKGKLHSVESIRKSASSSLAYVFAFQNDLSLKDVTARYCPNWSTTVRKNRVERDWLEVAISPYYGRRTDRDIREDHEMRRIHEQKPLPTAISDFKDHPLYALERHLLKFQAIYPPNPPTIGYTKTKEPIYSRDCVHTLHSRDIWLKQARVVKLGEQPYKIVKARPKWDRLTQTVIKDQPLEIFGYWQTQDYEPPTAENGIVPRNAYGNVELFKECMLPKKTVHLRLPGLNRICKKLNIDCASAVVGFDFHQGACHPMYDGFVVCEEFGDQVTAAWYQDQEEQERKEQEKYEARVYGNWKKLIKGLLIRERIKKKYNF